VHIPTGVDVTIFRPENGRAAARSSLGLPTDRKLILFGGWGATTDSRKGFSHLKTALDALSASSPGVAATLVVFGNSPDAHIGDELPFPVISVGRVHEEAKLAKIYAAADVFVAPSSEDNLPNTVLEALACGTPVVAFAAGGIPDAVEHRENGFLASPQAGGELGAGIAWTLADEQRLDRLRIAARETALARFDLAACAWRYIELFSQIADLEAEGR